MGETSAIEWTDATWNPIRGCTRVSEGCRHCYAETLAGRFSLPGQWGEGLATRTSKGARWTGKIDVAPDATFLAPLRWKKPKRIFVNSLSDLFHEAVPDAVIDRVFAVMALSPQHTFQLLTKRPERMRDYMASLDRAVVRAYTPPHQTPSLEDHHAMFFACIAPKPLAVWPLPNVWLGVSVEDQAAADETMRTSFVAALAALVGEVDRQALGGSDGRA
jgi:protein gp37